jgi:putative endonuclease
VIHATTKIGEYTIPLIGVPQSATDETCTRCEKSFHLTEIMLDGNGKPYCHACLIVIGMWFVYVVRCSDGSLYTGITNNLAHRIEWHNRGKGAKYTRSRRPVTLVYSKLCLTKRDAAAEERRIKALPKREKEDLVKGNVPSSGAA